MNNTDTSSYDDFGTACVSEAPHLALSGSISETPKTEKISQHLEQYSVHGDTHRPVGHTIKRLKAGVYDIGSDEHGVFYQPHSIISDSWLNFRDSLIVDVLKEIETFWNSGKLFEQYGFLQRRGYLLYGPAGTGKTVLIKQIIHQLVKKDGIVFIADNPYALIAGIKSFRKIEPTRKIIVIFEDIDAIINRYGEPSLLSYLDGEDSSNYLVNICSTNYPEKLPKRIVNRPRRIDRLIHITYPDAEMRRHFFSEKMQLIDKELEQWVVNTDKFTFAALTELVISVKCLGNDLMTSVKKMQSLLDAKPDSDNFDNNRKVGFV
jgi:hypothetical protein